MVGQDLTEYFNYLTTGYMPKRNYKKLLVSPSDMKRALLRKIQREVDLHRKEDPGLIRIKTNAMHDPDIIKALYRAGMAGVPVELVVRDTCCLRPGVPGISESIRVISIVDRFLEHARLFYFRNGGNEEYFIGSADTMKRNLEHRVEVVTPVESPALRQQLRHILDIQWNDRRGAWDMQPDGSYVQRQPTGEHDCLSSQQQLIHIASKRQKAAKVLKRLKSGGKSRKEFWQAY